MGSEVLPPVFDGTRSPSELPRPDLATRVLASCADGVILLSLGVYTLAMVVELFHPVVSLGAATATLVALLVVATAIYVSYFVGQHGCTPGLAFFDLCVVEREGKPVGVGRAFRHWAVSALGAVTRACGFDAAWASPPTRGSHEDRPSMLIAGPSLTPSGKLESALAVVMLLVPLVVLMACLLGKMCVR